MLRGRAMKRNLSEVYDPEKLLSNRFDGARFTVRQGRRSTAGMSCREAVGVERLVSIMQTISDYLRNPPSGA